MKVLRKQIATASLLVLGYVVAVAKSFTRHDFSDALTVAGLVYLVWGLWRLVDSMGFFDSSKWGLRKLIEIIKTRNYSGEGSSVGTYIDYLTDKKQGKPFKSIVFLAVVLLVAAQVLAR